MLSVIYFFTEMLTIADPSLIMHTVALDAMDLDLTLYPHITKWYKNFQDVHPELWNVAKEGLEGLRFYNKNPRDMSSLKHPLHPTSSEK
jgi:glutathione S-transferase